MSRYQPYSNYKESGIAWLGEVPEHWSSVSLKWISKIYSGGTPDKTNLSYWDEGSIPWLASGEVNQFYITTPTTYITKEAYSKSSAKWISKDALVMALAGQGKTKGMVAQLGIETTCNQSMAAIVLSAKIHSRFILWWLNSNYENIRNLAGGDLRDGLNLELLGGIPCPFMKLSEQIIIANFLDRETAKIDTLIAKQQRMIELLGEKRSALISHAVTKGLDLHVKMKDSGVEWLGEVPEHWGISKLRFIFSFSMGLNITKANLVDKGIPCVNYGEIHSKYGFEVSADRDSLKCVDNSYLENYKSSLLSKGDFVFADTSEDFEGAGNFTHLSSTTHAFAGYHTIIARQIHEHNFRFLAYLMDSVKFRNQIRLAVKGVKVFSITQSLLKNTTIWFPKIEEQAAIATYLDDKTQKIDTLIAKARQAIELMKERRTALISAAVTGKIDVREAV